MLVQAVTCQPRSSDRAALLRLIKRLVQSQPLAGRVGRKATVGIGLGDELLPAGVDKEADEIGPHIVAGKVSQYLCEVALVEVDLWRWSVESGQVERESTYVDEHQAVEVLVGFGHERSVWLVDAGVAVVGRGIGFGLNTLRGVLLEPFLAQPLEGCEGPGTSLDGICGCDKVGSRFRNVRRRVGVLERLFSWVYRPSSDVNLLALGNVERLQEGVHVLPAVELAEAAELSLCNGHKGVAGTVTIDELLNVGGFDLATVVDHLAVRVNKCLREVERSVVNLGESKRDVTVSDQFLFRLSQTSNCGVLTSGCP